MKFVNKYENYRTREGTYNIKASPDDMANQENAMYTSVKKMIQKYGILPKSTQTTPNEQLYIDNTYNDMTINEKLKFRRDLNDYFNELPPQLRKKFQDNPNDFIESVIYKEYDKLVETGIYSQEYAEQQRQKDLEKQNTISNLTQQINNLQAQLNEVQGQGQGGQKIENDTTV